MLRDLVTSKVMAKISATLVNMITEGCENECALTILLIFYKKKELTSI